MVLAICWRQVRNHPGRIFNHREVRGSKFTSKYALRRLVWHEIYGNAADASQREKNIKQYYRKWKVCLIEAMNPEWYTFTGFSGIAPLVRA